MVMSKTIKMDVKVSTMVRRLKQSVGMKLGLALPLEVRVEDLVLEDDQRLGYTNIAGKVIMASII